MRILVDSLGQAGFRFNFDGLIVYIDPYLSNYVEEIEGEKSKRQVPIMLPPEKIKDADWVLVTHSHIDHCDPKTIIPISQASPDCNFIGPNEVCSCIKSFGVSEQRVTEAQEYWNSLGNRLELISVPAAHPMVERDESGSLRCVGYIFRYNGKLIYHSGDTAVDLELIRAVQKWGDIDVAFLSVNERNYYRDHLGIIGNMSIRDAFRFAEDIGAKKVVPMHWDMFELNSVFPEEIEFLYEKLSPNFELSFRPSLIELD